MRLHLALVIFSFVVLPRLTFLPPWIHTLFPVIGPLVVPRVIGWLRSQARAHAAAAAVPIRPVPLQAQRALNLLFASAVCALALSLPQCAPENVFRATDSRLQIAPHVLFARLRAMREIGEQDEVLRARFRTAEAKLAYCAFGPDAVINCAWCLSAGTSGSVGATAYNYVLYSLPGLLAPHIVHLAVLGLATSAPVAGPEGARFRVPATVVGAALLVADVAQLAAYDMTANRAAVKLVHVDFAFWRMRVLRHAAIALADAALGLLLWAAASHRIFVRRPAVAARLESATRAAHDVLQTMLAVCLLENAVHRSQVLRAGREVYWRTEADVMAHTLDEHDVKSEVVRVIEALDMRSVENQARGSAEKLVSRLEGRREA